MPALLAALPALYFSRQFRSYLPIPQGWDDVRGWLFPLSALNLAFHEAGHMIFGLLGSDFIMTAGGTILQLAMPAACLFHFWRLDQRGSAVALLFWIGMNFIDISYYAADAKMQVIILITGSSGSEGGGHDWGFMLDALGVKSYCVGLGQLFFFVGCWLMAFPIFWGVHRAVRNKL